MSILVDDQLYSFDSLSINENGGYSTVTFGRIGIDMVYALSKAKEVVYRINYEGYYMDERYG